MGKQGRKEMNSFLCTTQKRKKKTLTPTDVPKTERPSFRLILCKVNDVRMHQPTASLVTQPNVRLLHLHTDGWQFVNYFKRISPEARDSKKTANPSLGNLETLVLSGCKMEEPDSSSVLLECHIMSSIIT